PPAVPAPGSGAGVDLAEAPTEVGTDEVPTPEAPEAAPARRPTFRERLGRARATFAGFLGRSKIDAETWDELEEALIRADVGIGPSTELIEH
ncbi:MAG: signal recognition particle receptor subunit alpha, partial [Acidimicrobiales bacterium]|nr:signal recognition particle receptor subunit alpha [Acidimicrobiales bacterium]